MEATSNEQCFCVCAFPHLFAGGGGKVLAQDLEGGLGQVGEFVRDLHTTNYHFHFLKLFPFP